MLRTIMVWWVVRPCIDWDCKMVASGSANDLDVVTFVLEIQTTLGNSGGSGGPQVLITCTQDQ